MMELDIIGVDSKVVGKISLPEQFEEPVRLDLISRAVLSMMSNNRQPYGADPRAGKKHSADLSKRRRKYRGSYGKGIARIPRKIHTRRGLQFNWTGAFAPMTVGGRRAHPPKAGKVWSRKLNDKERRKSLRSAIAASVDKSVVLQRGHKAPESFPFIISDDFENIDKTKSVHAALSSLGLADELGRASVRRVRAGKGKMRGRKYKRSVGPLIVVGDDCAVLRSARNIPGVDVVEVSKLNACLLAPGCHPGRLALFTKNAVDKLSSERLFL
jgi:large subunit ribosomal protein L4e